MQNMKTLKERHARELAAMENKERLAAMLPAEPRNIIQLRPERTPMACYDCDSLLTFIELAREFDCVVPMYYASGTFGLIKPLEIIDEAKNQIKGGPFAILFRVSQGEGYGPSAKLSFYARCKGQLFQISAEVNGGGYIGKADNLAATRERVTDGHGRLLHYSWRGNSIMNAYTDRCVIFGGSSGDSRDAHHMICSDDETEGPFADNSHAVAMLESIYRASDPRAEESGQ